MWGGWDNNSGTEPVGPRVPGNLKVGLDPHGLARFSSLGLPIDTSPFLIGVQNFSWQPNLDNPFSPTRKQTQVEGHFLDITKTIW